MSVREWPNKTEKFVKEVKLEMQKVSWPNRQTVVGSTVVVLIVTAFLAVCMWGFDFVWGRALELILRFSS